MFQFGNVLFKTQTSGSGNKCINAEASEEESVWNIANYCLLKLIIIKWVRSGAYNFCVF